LKRGLVCCGYPQVRSFIAISGILSFFVIESYFG
jgi:hypothetical protein